MDRKKDENRRVGENLSVDSLITSESTSKSINGVLLDSVVVMNSVETSSCSRDDIEDLGSQVDVLRSSDELEASAEGVITQETCDITVVAESSSNSADEVILDMVIDLNSERSFNGGNEGFGSKNGEMGSSDALVEAPAASIPQVISERTGQIDQSCSVNLSSLADMVVVETVIVINSNQVACVSGENREVEAKTNKSGTSKSSAEKREKRKASKAGKEYSVIDMNCGAGDGEEFKESWDGERVCRICYLNSEQASETVSDTSVSPTTVELIQLGCGCKDELGIAHRHCAEAWFKLKGNRSCEICGQTAKNITGIGDSRFMAEWNEQSSGSGSGSGSGINPSERAGGCWRGQPFCNFLMACLVIAFVLPWFFRISMF